MDRKYTLVLDLTTRLEGHTLYRIKALKDFGDVKKGDLGGFIEREDNLSQEENCWIYDDAMICDNAMICDDAIVCDNAKVSGNAMIYDNAMICDNAMVYGSAIVTSNAEIRENAIVCDKARIFNSAKVSGNSRVLGDARICDNAVIYGSAEIYGDAEVRGNAIVYGNAIVCGNAVISDNAIVCEHMSVSFSRATTDLRTDIKASLRCQCNLLMIDNKVIAYKIVNKDLSSLYDNNFVYKVGEIAEVEDAVVNNMPCTNGLHFSYLTYWDTCVLDYENKVYLIAEIDVEDIITIQRGKIRCKRAKILSKIDTV